MPTATWVLAKDASEKVNGFDFAECISRLARVEAKIEFLDGSIKPETYEGQGLHLRIMADALKDRIRKLHNER